MFGWRRTNLRNGALPVFYDNFKGHDHALYLQVMADARRFKLEPLVAWIREGRYVKAITIGHRILEPLCNSQAFIDLDSNHDIEYQALWPSQQTYICPRGLKDHKEAPENCGEKGHKGRGDQDIDFKEECVAHYARIQRSTRINWEVCKIERTDSA